MGEHSSDNPVFLGYPQDAIRPIVERLDRKSDDNLIHDVMTQIGSKIFQTGNENG
jgi:hypothetical protein